MRIPRHEVKPRMPRDPPLAPDPGAMASGNGHRPGSGCNLSASHDVLLAEGLAAACSSEGATLFIANR